MRKLFVMSVLSLMIPVLGCGAMPMNSSTQSQAMPKDGELTFPQDYKMFPTFLKGIQKPNAVRDLYINKTGAATEKGNRFGNGSILVMEVFNARKDMNGEFEKDTEGHLVKGDLAKVLVMQKGKDWGMNAPAEKKNGDWIYSAFKPNGERLDVDYAKCRGCHLPLGNAKDYVHRYDEYFEKRGNSY